MMRLYYHNSDGDMVEVPEHGRWTRADLWVKLEDVDAELERVEGKSRRKAKAADITQDALLAAVSAVSRSGGAVLGGEGEWRTATLWDVQEALSQFPPKVVLAKLRSAVKRGLLKGCTCGCRGEFEIVNQSPKMSEKSGSA